MKNTLFLLLFLSVFSTIAQTLTGTIKMLDSEETIPYATVQIGDNYGSITNEEGVFSINTDRFKPTSKLIFSCLGYQSKTILLKDFISIIYLKEEVNTLDEVYLDTKNLSALEIVLNTSKNLTKNYNFNYAKREIFFRRSYLTNVKQLKLQISKSKNYDKKMIKQFNYLIDSIKKSVIKNNSKSYKDILLDLYQKGNGEAKINIKKATHLINENKAVSQEKLEKDLFGIFKKLYKDKVFKVKVLFFKVEDSLKMDSEIKKDKKNENKLNTQQTKLSILKLYNNISLKTEEKENFFETILNTKKYNYKLVNTLYFNKELVYKIAFNPKKSSSKYRGTLFISDESFAILKLDFKMLKNKKTNGINLKALGLKQKIYDQKGAIVFAKNKQQIYVPKYIRQTRKHYTYVSVPVKFIENTKQKNKLKFKLKSRYEGITTERSELLFLNNLESNKTDYNSLKEQEKVNINRIKKYNPKTWEKHNIIAPTQSIINYDVEER